MKQAMFGVLVFLLAAPAALQASPTLSVTAVDSLDHGGRTDKDGCHRNRKTGDYHCH
jgi:hypothetical protein